MKKIKNSNVTKLLFTIILGFILILVSNQNGLSKLFNEEDNKAVKSGQINNLTIQTGSGVISSIPDDSNLRVYFFDVGQADSILVVNNGVSMLIDAGNNDDGELIVNNLKALGIAKIDYLIGTHPHEDHIGGLDNVINSFEIGTIYMPKVQTNTQTFEDVLDAVANKNLTIKSPEVGNTFSIGDANCEVMSIGEDSNNLNSCSIVIRMVCNDTSYLFMGDAETENEEVRSWPQSTVLKVGHHGSTTSSSQKFLNQVLPSISIISVGKDNKYGHPNDETLNKLEEINSTIYRTDEVQDILIIQEEAEN